MKPRQEEIRVSLQDLKGADCKGGRESGRGTYSIGLVVGKLLRSQDEPSLLPAL
jgi:hypothetical protein